MARNESRLSAEVSGVVQRWTADVGATVKRGALLAMIDPKDAELALLRAKAARDAARSRLTLGEAQLQRARELVAQGFFSQEALAQRETEVALQTSDLASAQAQFQTARRQLDKTEIRSPFDGVVVQRLAQQGESVAPGSVLFVLAQTSGAELHANVTPAETDSLQNTSSATFEPQGSGVRLPVRLLRLTATVQSSTRTQTARLSFAKPAQAPVPGTAGLLRWSDPSPHVPATLVVKRANALGIFVREANQARFVPLAGAQEGRPAPVNLPATAQVVVRGQAALQDGQPLN
jgi:RND family efflux transporter MFP subunit